MKKIFYFSIIFLPIFLLFRSKQSPKISIDYNEYSTSINKFTFELYNKILKNSCNQNIFISGFSIHSAMGMVYEGSKGETQKEIENVFFINPKDKNRLGIIKSFIEELNKEEKNKLLNANALWIQKDYKILKEYLSIIDNYYSGKATNLDFAKEGEKSRKIINDWVEEKTNSKIKDLIPAGYLDFEVKLVLTNAIYFKGLWLLQFDKNLTKEEDFKKEDGEKIKVKMMEMSGKKFRYGEDENFQILEMPYDGEGLSMFIILPKINNLNINYEKFNELKGKLSKQKVDIFIPKFKFEKKYFLSSILKDMGVKTAFLDQADLSGITGKRDLKIGDVIHQSFIQVDEEGTEAAAATGITLRLTSIMIQRTPIFKADHPFFFVIQHNKTNCILFAGKVANPES